MTKKNSKKKAGRRGLVAGTKTARLAGLLAKYARAHSSGNDRAKAEAREGIAFMVGIR